MMREPKGVDFNFWFFIVISVWMILFLMARTEAAVPPKAPIKDHCLIRLDNRGVAKVAIAVDGTVLDFPLKPTKVILGRKNSFGIEYVESDLAISPLSPVSRSHLYVYLEGRRFTFDLSTVSGTGCPVLLVRDSKDNQVTMDAYFHSKK